MFLLYLIKLAMFYRHYSEQGVGDLILHPLLLMYHSTIPAPAKIAV